MWVLKSFSKVVAGPFKSQAEMAKKLGLSQQHVNRQIRKCNFRFHLDGQTVFAHREKEFVGGGKKGSDKEELAINLGVSHQAVDKVLSQNSSGFVQTPQGKVRIQKLKPGEKPTLPAVRVLWDDDTEKKDFVSFADAAKELKIHLKTIPRAIKAGRDSFTRKSDGKKFTFEIPAENTPSRKKPKPPSEEQKQKWAEAKRRCDIADEFRRHSGWQRNLSIEEMDRLNKLRRAEVAKHERKMNPSPAEKEPKPREEPPQPPIPAPRKKVPLLQPPIPAPRKKVPSVPVIPPEEPAASTPLPRRLFSRRKASPEKTFQPPTPPEVVEILKAGKTFSFETSKKLEPKTFFPDALARYIKSGCGKLFVQGPKKHQTLICNGKLVLLSDLVKEIIVFHIRDQMWKDDAGATAFTEKAFEFNWTKKKTKDWISAKFVAGVRRLDDETIEKICKEFMKLV